MAALRNGIQTVIIPADNEKDLDEIDQTVRNALNFVLVDQAEQVLAQAILAPGGALERDKALDAKLPDSQGRGHAGPAAVRRSNMAINLQKAEFILSAVAPKFFLRDGLPQVAFSGRSNVGKSSVINRLLNRKNFARVGAAPGKTTQINYFKIDNAFYLVDLPGYGYAKVSKAERDRWGKLMESYFADPELMTLGVMIVDSRHKPTADDCTMARWYREAAAPLWWWPINWTS